MAASARFESASASSSEAYTNGKRGSSSSLDRSASFRSGNLSQFLSLEPITIGDKKIDRSGELKRVMGLIVASTNEDDNLSSPVAEDLKRLRSSVADTCNTARMLFFLFKASQQALIPLVVPKLGSNALACKYLALYDNECWNDPRDFAKPVKEIALPQDVLMNKVTTSCKICSGSHDTQHCMEDPEQAFVEYASSHIDEAGVLKAITDQIAGALPSDTVKNLKLSTSPTSLLRPGMEIELQQPDEPEPTLEDEFQGLHLNLLVLEVLAHASVYNAILDKYVESLELGKNRSVFVQGEIPAKMEDPGLFTLPCRLGDSEPFDTLADLGSCVNIIPLYLFKKLNIELLEETDHIFRLADGTKSYPIRIVIDVEVHIGKLKLLNDCYVIDMKKNHETPLLVGRGFLATANAVIDCRMAKIAVGEGITRSVFSVKGVDLGEEEALYWTTLGKRESYKP
ncbi:MAK10-like protein [Tanacetum coccineum]